MLAEILSELAADVVECLLKSVLGMNQTGPSCSRRSVDDYEQHVQIVTGVKGGTPDIGDKAATLNDGRIRASRLHLNGKGRSPSTSMKDEVDPLVIYE